MTTMSQFHQALDDGEFPVRWSNNFANYGLPLPLIAHQIPAYLGAVLIGLGLPVVTSYNLVLFAGIFIGNMLYFNFLKGHFNNRLAFTGAIFYAFFAYRIVNIYTRGALPEVFSSGIFPLVLMATDRLFESQYLKGIILLILGFSGIALTHPMMLVIYGSLFVAYFLFNSIKKKDVKTCYFAIAGTCIGSLIASYYLIPLIMEIKYFYQGQMQNNFDYTGYLSLKNFIDDGWYYFYTHPGPRGHFIAFGQIELMVYLCGLLISAIFFIKKKAQKNQQLFFWTILSTCFLLMLLPVSSFLYKYVPFLGQIQFPWRFLNAFQITLPIILILGIKSIKKINTNWFLIIIVFVVFIFRIPQLYGKNYVNIDEKNFNFVKSNLHTQNLNTIWSGNSEDYPTKQKQVEIISGDGAITGQEIKNASRIYNITANSELNLVDYTFYFPGWKVYIDGSASPIEFQDMNYRGLITFKSPPGNHKIAVVYENTKVRMFSSVLSVIGIMILITLVGIEIKTNREHRYSTDKS